MWEKKTYDILHKIRIGQMLNRWGFCPFLKATAVEEAL
jgi:hypothetical protein